jgi:hypothetical protein
MVEFAGKILWFILRYLTSPISVEISYLQFEDFSTDAYDCVVVVSPHPRRYHVRLVLSNRSDGPVYVVAYSACIGDAYALSRTRFASALRLEPHEPKEHSIVLPVDADCDPIGMGRFSISIYPSVGRMAKANGVFPVG